MDKKLVVEATSAGASYGFEMGFKTAANFVKSISEDIPDENMKKMALIIAEGYEKFFSQAHAEFMRGLETKVLIDEESGKIKTMR